MRRQPPQIVEQDFHVAQRGAVVHDASAQTEEPAETRVRQIGAAVLLQLDEQVFVQCIQLFFARVRSASAPDSASSNRRGTIAETKDRKLDRRQHLEIFARPHQPLEMSGAGQVLLNHFTEHAQADTF